MVTVMVMAITLTIAVPSFQTAIRNNQLAANANQLVSALNLARSEAIKRGMRVTLRKTSAYWESGWQVFTDNPNGGGNYGIQDGADETLRVYGAFPASYILTGNNNFTNYISFLPSGESNNMGSFALCYSNADRTGSIAPEKDAARLIIVNKVGRVRLGLDTDHDRIPNKDDGTNLASCTNP